MDLEHFMEVNWKALVYQDFYAHVGFLWFTFVRTVCRAFRIPKQFTLQRLSGSHRFSLHLQCCLLSKMRSLRPELKKAITTGFHSIIQQLQRGSEWLASITLLRNLQLLNSILILVYDPSGVLWVADSHPKLSVKFFWCAMVPDCSITDKINQFGRAK